LSSTRKYCEGFRQVVITDQDGSELSINVGVYYTVLVIYRKNTFLINNE